MKFCFLVFVLAMATVANAKSDSKKELEKQLNKMLDGHAYVLRNFYHGEHLVFDGEGKMLSGGTKGELEDAGFKVNKVEVKGETIQLFGHHGAAYYDEYNQLDLYPERESMQIELHLAGPADQPHVEALLQEIFFTKTDTIPHPPPAEFPMAANSFEPNTGEGKRLSSPDGKSLTAGSGIEPPRAIRYNNPPLTAAALRERWNGIVLLYIVIGANGHVTQAKVVRHAPFGLDQAALNAVKDWLFAPAEKDGRPVAVQASVEVDFRTY